MRRLTTIVGVIWLAWAAGLQAHRVDEYLHATRVFVGQDEVRLEIDLTPGIEVAAQVLRGIDVDGNGQLSDEERGRYAAQVIGATTLDLDGRPLPVVLSSYDFPSVDDLHSGTGTIRLLAHARARAVASGSHELRFANFHEPAISVYLANAMTPADGITIVDQHRDAWQRQFAIRFNGTSTAGSLTAWPTFLSGVGLMLLLWWVRGGDGRHRVWLAKVGHTRCP